MNSLDFTGKPNRTAMSPHEKNEERRLIEQQTKLWLKQGNKIQIIEPGFSRFGYAPLESAILQKKRRAAARYELRVK